MSNFAVTRLAYLLGVPEQMINSQLSPDQSIEAFSNVENAPKIRACCRARQVVLFHFTGSKKIFSLPDSLRSYCQKETFDELQHEFREAGDSWTFANRMTELIMEHAGETLTAMGIPHVGALLEHIFKWPQQNKSTFMTLSQQYHNKAFSFPYSTFIPKPKSFGKSLRYLLTNDEVLFSATPIVLTISAQSCEEKAGSSPAPAPFDFPNVTYINKPFSTTDILYQDGVCISYIDYDNMPPFLVAQICSSGTEQHPVKLFYDDRARGDIETMMRFPFVEFCFVERLKAEKSLVDSRILTEVVQDCYVRHPKQVNLYSSDSDFFALAPILKQEDVAFTVVGREENICPAYVGKLGEHNASCYILSEFAVVPIPNTELIAELLRYKMLHMTLGDCNIQDITKDILASFADEKYQTLLVKPTEAEVMRLIDGARLLLKNGTLTIEFQSDEKKD